MIPSSPRSPVFAGDLGTPALDRIVPMAGDWQSSFERLPAQRAGTHLYGGWLHHSRM
jgi:hypothetical protein